MNNHLPLAITEKTLKETEKRWMEVARRSENALVLYPPRMDRHWRVPQIIRRNQDLFDFYIVNLSEKRVDDVQDWIGLISSWKLHDVSKSNVIFIMDGEELVMNKKHLLPAMVDFSLNTPKSSIFILSEVYPYEAIPPTLMQNILYQPLYGEEDVFAFISYLGKKMEVKISKAERNLIFKKCGGQLWLVKQAIRFRAGGCQGEMFIHDDLRLKTKIILESLSENEREVLQNIVLDLKVPNSSAKDHLERTSIIHEGRITIEVLEEYLKQQIIKNTQLKVKFSKVFLSGVCIDPFLSRKEKDILVLFLKQVKSNISREQVAEVLWGKDYLEEYSDWSLDQAIKRLRVKLVKLGISKDLIKTVKGRGYLWQG